MSLGVGRGGGGGGGWGLFGVLFYQGVLKLGSGNGRSQRLHISLPPVEDRGEGMAGPVLRRDQRSSFNGTETEVPCWPPCQVTDTGLLSRQEVW